MSDEFAKIKAVVWPEGTGQIMVIFGIAVALIVAKYVWLRHTCEGDIAFCDAGNRKVIDVPWLENCCSWWPISHFILFFFLGLLFPHHDVPILLAGILWEGIESLVSVITSSQRQPTLSDGKVEYAQNWWAGSLKDILFDFAGFYTGKSLVLLAQRL